MYVYFAALELYELSFSVAMLNETLIELEKLEKMIIATLREHFFAAESFS